MFSKRRNKHKLLSIFIILLFAFNISYVQPALALNGGSGSKAYNFQGYRYIDAHDIEVWFDKNTPSVGVSQVKIYQGPDASGQALQIQSTAGVTDSNISGPIGITNGLSKGACIKITTSDTFTPGALYTVVFNRAIMANNGSSLGSYGDQDVTFSFTAPDIAGTPNWSGTYSGSAQGSLNLFQLNNATNVPVEKNIGFSVNIPVANYNDVLNGLVLSKGGVPVPLDPTIDKNQDGDIYTPVVTDDHTYFFYPMTGSGTDTSYNLAYSSNYTLSIPSITLVTGLTIPAQTVTFTTTANDPPSKVSPVPTAAISNDGSNLAISWTAATGATNYNVYASEDPNWNFEKLNASPITGLTYTTSGLKPNTAYYFRVASVYNGSEALFSDYATATTPAAPAPTVSSAATSDPTHIVLTMSNPLTGTAADASAFTVTGVASNPTVTNTTVSGITVALTLSSAIANGDNNVKLSYLKSGENNLTNGTEAADFSGQSVTNNVPAQDLSTASAALSPSGSKSAGVSFNISITGAKDISGNYISGSVGVKVTNSSYGQVFDGNVTFNTSGSAIVTIPAATSSLTKAGNYNLTVSVAGVTPQPTVPVTIVPGSPDSTQSTLAISPLLTKGGTSTVTMTIKDKYNNLLKNDSKNYKYTVTVTNANPTTNESYTVDGNVVTSTTTTNQKTKVTDANGQFSFQVTMPSVIDPGDGFSIQVMQGGSTKIGCALAYKVSDFSSASAALSPAGSQLSGAGFNINLTGAQDVLGNALSGSVGVTVTNGSAGQVFSGNVTFTSGSATVAIPARTSSLITAGNYTLNVAIDGVTPKPTVPVTIDVATPNPNFVSADTNISGTLVTLQFDRAMAALPTTPAGFSVQVGGSDDSVKGVVLNTDPSKVELILNNAISNGQTATVSYSAGAVTAADGGVLASFEAQPVANKVLLDGYITTLLGDGTSANTGDNGPATSATAKAANNVAVDGMGNVYFVDQIINSVYTVREIAASSHTQFGINMTAGNVYKVAGTGSSGYAVSEDNNSALNAKLSRWVHGIAVDASGNLYIADGFNNRIREVADTDHTQFGINMTTGYIYTVAGSGVPTGGFPSANYVSGDENIAATSAHLANPFAVAVDSDGNLFIADSTNNRVRKVDANGIITTIAGTGTNKSSGDSGTAINFNLNPQAIALDGAGNIYISDVTNCRVLKLDPSGNITTIAGNKTNMDAGSTTLATNVGVSVSGITSDSAGNIYLAEGNWDRVDKVAPDGSITTVAGFGWINPLAAILPFNGDGIPATTAIIGSANDVAIDGRGNIYIADRGHDRILFVKNAQHVVVPPPVVTSAATSDQTHIVLTMSRALLGTAGDPAAFTVSEATSSTTVSAVAIAGNSVTLTLSSAIDPSKSITVSYSKTGGIHTFAYDYSNLTAVDNFSTVMFGDENTVEINGNIQNANYFAKPGSALKVGSSQLNTLVDGSKTATLPALNILAVISSISADSPVSVNIPAQVKVSGPKDWDGTINVPTIQPNDSVTVTPDPGYSSPVVSNVIEVGYGDVPLTFDKAVRILIPGGAGKDVGYYRSGVFTKITTTLSEDSQTAADALPDGGDAKIDDGSDLVIWTKHFTKFVTYTQTQTQTQTQTPSSSNGGSRGSGGSTGGPSSGSLPTTSLPSTSTPQVSATPMVSSTVAPDSKTATTVLAKDGTQVLIPVGALTNTGAPVEITISQDTQTVNPTISGIVCYDPQLTERSFGPSGTVFKVPVTITLPFGSANIDATDLPYLAIFLWQTDHWQKVGGVIDPVNKTISVAVSHFSTYRIMADKTAIEERIGGIDRYETAVKIAQNYFATGADTVVLTRGDISADALTAVPLAKHLNAPLLLTPQDKLPDQVLKEIKTLGAKTVYIVGGEMAVSSQIADVISGQGINIQRVAGIDRYATAYEVAKLLGSTGKAVIVNGNDYAYPDALSISSWAAYNGVPILYADGTDKLPDVTVKALKEFNVSQTILVGGTAVLPQSLESLVPNSERYAGVDRFDTNSQVLSKLQPNATQIFVATGNNFADALAGAAVAGQTNAWLILTGSSKTKDSTLTSEQQQLLKSAKGIRDLHVFGGPVAVPDATLNEIKTSLGL